MRWFVKRILFTGFIDDGNSSKELLDCICSNKLYLENDYKISESQIKSELNKNYDYVIMFGQKPNSKSIYIETVVTQNEETHSTNYNYIPLLKHLEENKFTVKFSKTDKKTLCNNVYFHALKYIKQNNLKTKCIFIHIPYLKNIDIKFFFNVIDKFNW
jgi:hypothetical protein